MDRQLYEEMTRNLEKLDREQGLTGRQIFLFGHCSAAEELADMLLDRGQTPAGFLDNNGAKHGKTAAQAALRFLLQSGVVVIPKSTHKERMGQNFDVFDFQLPPEEMAAIATLDEGESLFFSHYDPATVEMITGLKR